MEKNQLQMFFGLGMDFFEQSVRNHGFSPKIRLLRTNHKDTEVFEEFVVHHSATLNDPPKKEHPEFHARKAGGWKGDTVTGHLPL